MCKSPSPLRTAAGGRAESDLLYCNQDRRLLRLTRWNLRVSRLLPQHLAQCNTPPPWGPSPWYCHRSPSVLPGASSARGPSSGGSAALPPPPPVFYGRTDFETQQNRKPCVS